MLEKFVMPGVSRLPNLLAAYNPRPDLPCRGQGCKRVFKYGKCRVKHEKKEHGLTVADEDATSESKVDDKEGTEDYVYNYGCLHLSIGLLLRSADDSVKEGDGERLLRVWNFLTVFLPGKQPQQICISCSPSQGISAWLTYSKRGT